MPKALAGDAAGHVIEPRGLMIRPANKQPVRASEAEFLPAGRVRLRNVRREVGALYVPSTGMVERNYIMPNGL